MAVPVLVLVILPFVLGAGARAVTEEATDCRRARVEVVVVEGGFATLGVAAGRVLGAVADEEDKGVPFFTDEIDGEDLCPGLVVVAPTAGAVEVFAVVERLSVAAVGLAKEDRADSLPGVGLAADPAH